jgi:serine/threonine-protein kinase
MTDPTWTNGSPHDPSPARELEQLWAQGQPPDPFAFLEAAGPCDPAAAAAVLAVDQWQRWHAGQRPAAEEYLRRCPALAGDAAAALEVIYGEFLVRRALGEPAEPQEYLDRFPQFAAGLSEQFALFGAMDTGSGGKTAHPSLPLTGPGGAGLTAAGDLPELPGYRVLGELGRGGMGMVYRAFEPRLGRSLAVKVLLPEHRDDAGLRRRFLKEAQIMGRLQHPGVAPVHELGELPDGRPFFTMKRVMGQTLAELLPSPVADGGAPGPRTANGEPAAAPLLAVFEQVCQTVAYAHSRGILHRDLKPANVMVGAFGEVQVMDWGLAKVQTEAGEEPRPPFLAGPTPSPGGPGQTCLSAAEKTEAGAVLGTPAYMPPEQARGEVDRLDERSDVFGLGAILCEVLTGQPPYMARDSWQVHLQAVQGDLADAQRRLEASGAEAELVALARRCLAADPAERPPDASAVAREIGGYQASVAQRLRAAELAAARAAAQAEQERKARRLTVALAGAVLALVVLGGGGWWWWQQEQARKELRAQAARRHVDEALRQAAQFRQQARWADAKAVLKQAEDRLETDAPDELRAPLVQAREDLTLAAKLDGIRLGRAALVDGKMVQFLAAPKYARAFRAHGLNVLGGDLEELVAQIQGSAIREQLVAALDDWASVEPKRVKVRRLLEVARRADPGRLKDQLRDVKVWRDRQRLLRLARAAKGAQLSPALVETLAALLAQVKESPLEFLRRAREQHPGDFWLNFMLANELNTPHQRERAIGYYRVALVIRPRSNIVYNNLGNALKDQGMVAEAVQAYRRAIALDPKDIWPHLNLGTTLIAQGQLREAVRAYRRAIALDPKDAKAHLGLGNALMAQGKWALAVKAYRRAIALDPKYALAHYNLGNALSGQGKLTEAVKAYRRAIAVQKDNAEAHCNLGCALLRQGRFPEALAALKRGHALGSQNPHWPHPSAQWVRHCQRLLELDPQLPAVLVGTAQPKDAAERIEFAHLCALKQQYGDAARFFATAFAARPKLADDLAAGHRYNAACASALAGCGRGKGAGQFEAKEKARLRGQALTWLRADLALRTKQLTAGSPDRTAAQGALGHWQKDRDLAGVRERAALAKLPETERQEWTKFWADVAKLLQKVRSPK